jgi:pilus assembly protein FimV
VVKQYTENQYDDDLTVGTDEYDDSYHTDVDDLFAFSTDDESSISRLKSLILSIDWEITDEVLMQFNEELADLRDIWAGEKLNLVYVQALEKISKYIYHKKADSHPSAIKLLLTLYHNLEKIVSSVDLSEEQKKEILLLDVKKFENLKRLIGEQSKQSQEIEDPEASVKPTAPTDEVDVVGDDELQNLKAIVLGIDWEITDEDLNDLRQEVLRLEEKYADRKPILILLQGIGTIGAYIKLKKSDAHADAFKVLHFFYESFEKIALTPMGLEEEKAILFPAVEKFNSFKIQVGKTISPELVSAKEEEIDEESDATASDALDGVMPAFADIPGEETSGFQAEEEAQALGLDSSGNVGSHVDTFFADGGILADEPSTDYSTDDEEADAVEEMIGESEMFAGETNSVATPIAKEVALQGVDVEEDEDEEPAHKLAAAGAALAPALSIEEEDTEEPGSLFSEEEIVQNENFDSPAKEISTSDLTPHAAEEYESEETDRDLVIWTKILPCRV